MKPLGLCLLSLCLFAGLAGCHHAGRHSACVDYGGQPAWGSKDYRANKRCERCNKQCSKCDEQYAKCRQKCEKCMAKNCTGRGIPGVGGTMGGPCGVCGVEGCVGMGFTPGAQLGMPGTFGANDCSHAGFTTGGSCSCSEGPNTTFQNPGIPTSGGGCSCGGNHGPTTVPAPVPGVGMSTFQQAIPNQSSYCSTCNQNHTTTSYTVPSSVPTTFDAGGTYDEITYGGVLPQTNTPPTPNPINQPMPTVPAK